MIIAQIEGGLGSQMFGYAAARRLALVHGVEVAIDKRNFRTYDKFVPGLDHFAIEAITLGDDDADQICGPDNSRIKLVTPRHLHFDSDVLEISESDVLMIGNFISEDYFFDVSSIIRRDFRRVSELSEYSKLGKGFLDELELRGFQPVAVHIRLGDKMFDPEINRIHGTCTHEYYENAIALMNRIVDRPWFVFFSDNPEWVAERYKGENVTVMLAPPETDAVEDMTLMTFCRHHILGNSTYSWWGAWLAENSDQVVIGPRPFIADRSFNTEDTLLRNWISLSAVPVPEPKLKPSPQAPLLQVQNTDLQDSLTKLVAGIRKISNS